MSILQTLLLCLGLLVLVQANLGAPPPSGSSTPTTTAATSPPVALSANSSGSATSSATDSSGSASSTPNSNNTNNPATGGSPLLFFVALGFGVVFTNLWIIVGVKYCFRYNHRHRARLAEAEADAMEMGNPNRPHRRRREKKLMTMDEVNERFPRVTYKTWRAKRESNGLTGAGGVTMATGSGVTGSRPATVHESQAIAAAAETSTPSSPTDLGKVQGTSDTPAEKTQGSAAVEQKEDDTVAQQREEDPVAQEVKGNEDAVRSPPTEQPECHADAKEVEKPVDLTIAPPTELPRVSDEEVEEDDDDAHALPTNPDMDMTVPGDTCAICIDNLEDDDDVRGLTCGHAFHVSCLDPWLTSRRASCPLCKADFYVPKVRPEGEEGADNAESNSQRTQINPSTWRERGRGVQNRPLFHPRRPQNRNAPGDGNQNRAPFSIFRGGRRAAPASTSPNGSPLSPQINVQQQLDNQPPLPTRSWRERISIPRRSNGYTTSYDRRRSAAAAAAMQGSGQSQSPTPAGSVSVPMSTAR